MWQNGDGMGWWMVWGMLMMLLFWGGLTALVIWTIRSLTGRTGDDDALDIARRRYASGELTQEQFERLRNDLGRGAHA